MPYENRAFFSFLQILPTWQEFWFLLLFPHFQYFDRSDHIRCCKRAEVFYGYYRFRYYCLYDFPDFQKEYLDKDYEEDDEVTIIRTKKFGIKPMYPEDACVQMELLGHNFFVFYNAETEQVNVVYKRKGNTYGLIEPEF